LLLAAALEEARRIELDGARAAVEARTAHALARRGELAREQLAIDQALARQHAGVIAREQAARAFGPAQRGAGVEAEQPARVALARARVLLAAGLALDRTPAPEATTAIEAAERSPKDAAASLRALAAAERALGRARANNAVPSEAERAALRAMAAERGLQLESSARGLAIVLDDRAASSSGLGPDGARQLAQIGALLRAHPHGQVLVEPGGSDAAQRRRAERVRSSLARSLGGGDRIRVDAQQQAERSGEPRTRVWLPSYAAPANE
jgi:hypothetical protein